MAGDVERYDLSQLNGLALPGSRIRLSAWSEGDMPARYTVSYIDHEAVWHAGESCVSMQDAIANAAKAATDAVVVIRDDGPGATVIVRNGRMEFL